MTTIYTFFFFNDTATTEIYTLSLHDALPILSEAPTGFEVVAKTNNCPVAAMQNVAKKLYGVQFHPEVEHSLDRKSTRLNSSHANISYAVFCLKKKKTTEMISTYIT